MSAEADAERRMHWFRLARELGQEDDFRALLDDVRRDGWKQPTRDQLASAAHAYFCVTPDAPTHEPDEIDYDKADEIIEILGKL